MSDQPQQPQQPAPARNPGTYVPLEYAGGQRPALAQRISRWVAGAAAAWFLIFIPTFLGRASAIKENPLPRWAIPAVALTAAACGTYAWLVRRSKPDLSAGVWVGVGIGLLHAGWCFVSV
jgi:hypothetical protein